MSHEHDCRHLRYDLRYCVECDVVYCIKCKREWGEMVYRPNVKVETIPIDTEVCCADDPRFESKSSHLHDYIGRPWPLE